MADDVQAMLDRLKNRPAENAWPAEVNWNIVYHRLQQGKAGVADCKCAVCAPYMAMIAEKYWK